MSNPLYLAIVRVQTIVSSDGNSRIRMYMSGSDEDGYPVEFFTTIHHDGDITELAQIIKNNIEEVEEYE